MWSWRQALGCNTVGKEALQRIVEKYGGPTRKLYGIVFNNSEHDENLQMLIKYWQGKHLKVFQDVENDDDAATIGTFTTFTPSSPKFYGCSLGFAFLDVRDNDPVGSTVYIQTANNFMVEGVVSTLPFLQREG